MGWDLAPAGFTDDYTGTIADLVFQPGEYGPQALVTVDLDEPFTAADGTLQNARTIYLRIQKGFNVAPDGTLLHESGDLDKKMKSDGSQWVKFAERVIELEPSLRDKLTGGVTSTDGWVGGYRFHFMTEGAGKDYKFKDDKGVEQSGKSKGQVMPVEYLGTTDAPVAGTVGASTSNGAFSLSTLPDATIEALMALAESDTFASDVLKGGLLDRKALGEAYGPTTAALGNGELQQALRAF